MQRLSKLFPLLAVATLSMAESTPAAQPTPEAKKVPFAKKTYNDETGIVAITFSDPSNTVVELDTSKCSDEIRTLLMLHGASQKIGDSYAGVKGNFGEGINNAKAVVQQLLAGEWKATGEERGPRLQELAEAIARIKGAPVEAALKAVEAATDEQRASWRSNAQVKAAIAQGRAEKAQKALEGSQPVELVVNLA